MNLEASCEGLNCYKERVQNGIGGFWWSELMSKEHCAICQGHLTDLEYFLVAVLVINKRVALGGIASEVDSGTIRGEHRFSLFFLECLTWPLDHLLALATIDVIQPYFTSTQGTGGREMFASRDELAIRAPGRVV